MSRRKSLTTKDIHAPWWDNHEVVVIRSMNSDDEEFINDGLAGFAEDNKTVVIYSGRTKRLTLQRAVLRWTLTDERGQPLPLTRETIGALAPEDSKFIYDEIQKLNAPMSAAEKKDSDNKSMTGIEEKAK